MPINTPSFRLLDERCDGTAADQILTMHEAGDSYETIARWCDRMRDVSVTAETIRRWISQMKEADQ